MDMKTTINIKLLDLASNIVSAYLSNNSVEVIDIPNLINNIYTSLENCVHQHNEDDLRINDKLISKTVFEEYIVCLEDGKRVTMLKPYLERKHGITPEEYIKKWRLPLNYPMTAPNYSKLRSSLAKKNKLGENR